MAELPHMPVKVNDMLGDAGHLPNGQFGAYCKLLFRWWSHGALPIADERKLAGWACTSVKGLEPLKPFLKKTDLGWIQRRLAVRYAECLSKSIKAQNSAKAKKGADVDERTLNERISDAYAKRGVSLPLSIKHEPIVGANAPTQKEKNKNQKRKARGDVPIETQLPPAEEGWLMSFVEDFGSRWGEERLFVWFVEDGAWNIFKRGEQIVVETAKRFTEEQIPYRFGGWMDRYFGKGKWKVERI